MAVTHIPQSRVSATLSADAVPNVFTVISSMQAAPTFQRSKPGRYINIKDSLTDAMNRIKLREGLVPIKALAQHVGGCAPDWLFFHLILIV
jgi:hypothetical protein